MLSLLLSPLACGDDSIAGEGAEQAESGETGAEGDGDESGDDGEFGPETELTLRLDDQAPPDLILEMGRDEVAALFGAVAEKIELLQLDTTPLLTHTLNTIKLACGSDWQLDQEDPNHDCSQTPLGQTFGNGNWQTSAEYSMVRILTMTPANSVVEGTSLAGVAGVSNWFDFFTGGFSGMMAESLKIKRTDEFLDTQAVVASLKHNLIATHPEASEDGKISVTLADALSDMATLSERLGPVGEHPGILNPDFPTSGQVFGPDFQMKVVAESNLRVLDGVDLSAGKDYISVIVDLQGPSFTDEAEFDFNDPDKFSLTGLNPNPTLDLRFAINEHPSFIPACTEAVSPACVDNKPGWPIGNNLVWTLDPWQLEYIIAYAGTLKYGALTSVVTKVFVDLVEVGQNGNPPGWAEFNVPLGFLFNEPPAQYVWELINEVAQYDLHHLDNYTFPEGSANVEFTLFEVPVGITGAEAADAVRPFLQAQASEIAGYLLGNYKQNNGPVDFYYRRADDGVPYLFWVAAEDLAEGKPYGWAKPGFYADPGLSEKLSRTDVGVGDSTHEKLRVAPGESIVYAQDDEGQTYRIRIVAPDEGDPKEIALYVAKQV